MLSLQIVHRRFVPLLRSIAAYRGAHGHSHDGQACGHSHGLPEEKDGGHGHSHSDAPPELDQQTGLPLEQRAKNILVGNWRGQLTTIVAGKRDGDEPAMYSTLAPFTLLPDGNAITFVNQAHLDNVASDGLGSLTIGFTDPPALAAALRVNGRPILPRISLLGHLEPLPSDLADYAARRLAQRHPGSAPEGLAAMPALRFAPRECLWICPQGKQYPFPAAALAGALADPLAPGSAALLGRLNGAADAQQTFREFCAVYLSVPVDEAHMYQVDRTGFSLMGREGGGSWRDFRFAFQKEVRDAAALERQLQEMKAELDELAAAPADGAEGAGGGAGPAGGEPAAAVGLEVKSGDKRAS